MGYGSDGVCWMSWKHRGIIYLFFMPSGLALILNIALVTATALTLIQIQSTQSALPRQSTSLTVKCIFGIVARISVSMGLEWIMGIILYFAPHHLGLQYAFVLVIGLHGFWLLISTLTLGIWRKLRVRIKAYLRSVCPSICTLSSICPSVHPIVNLSIRPSVGQSVQPSTGP